MLLGAAEAPLSAAFEAAALWTLREQQRQAQQRGALTADPQSPWATGDGWRLNGTQSRELRFRHGGQETALDVRYTDAGFALDGAAAVLAGAAYEIDFSLRERRTQAHVVAAGTVLHVFLDGRRHVLTRVDPLAQAGATQDAHGGLMAPMPGKIVALLVEAGATVEKGAPLVVMEAMKMEHTLCAPANGTVRALLCALGEQVKEGIELVAFEAAAPV